MKVAMYNVEEHTPHKNIERKQTAVLLLPCCAGLHVTKHTRIANAHVLNPSVP